MRLSISLLASVGLVGTVAAQTPNQLEMGSGATNFTTRAAMPGTSIGDVCQRYMSEHYACLGQYVDPVTQTLVGRVTTLYTVNQDQNASTQESFTVGIIGADPLGVFPVTHAPNSAVDLLRTAPIPTPTSTITTAAAWIWTLTLATPYDALPQSADFYMVCGLPANAAWVADGMSVHMSGWAQSVNVDQPYIGGPNPIPACVYTIDRSTAVPLVSGRQDRSQRIWPGMPGAISQLGADIDPTFQLVNVPYPNYGAAGRYPDHNITRLDGIAFKFTDINNPFSLCATIGGFGGFGAATPLPPGFDGNLCLQAFTILSITFAQGVTDGAGVYAQTTFPFPNSWATGVGFMSFQSIVVTPAATLKMSNGAAFNAQ